MKSWEIRLFPSGHRLDADTIVVPENLKELAILIPILGIAGARYGRFKAKM
jgi:hypothetical protein